MKLDLQCKITTSVKAKMCLCASASPAVTAPMPLILLVLTDDRSDLFHYILSQEPRTVEYERRTAAVFRRAQNAKIINGRCLRSRRPPDFLSLSHLWVCSVGLKKHEGKTRDVSPLVLSALRSSLLAADDRGRAEASQHQSCELISAEDALIVN